VNARDIDVAIVGAGIIGCLIAARITESHPSWAVTVVERDAVGSGASRRSAGVHFPRGTSPRVRTMSEHSARYYDSLVSSQPSLPIYPLPMVVHSSDAERLHETYLAEAHLARAAGGHSWNGGGSHYADVAAIAAAVGYRLRPHVCFREGVGVVSITPDDDAVDVTLSTGETLRAGVAILAPGPWIDAEPWRALTAPLGLRVKKIVALHIAGRPERHDPLTVFDDDDSFLLPVHHRGHWLFSYTCTEWDVNPDHLDGALSEGDLAPALAALRRHAPHMVPRVSGGRVFCDAFSVERQPVVTRLDAAGRVVFAGAASGAGYRLAPAIAAEAADLLTLIEGETRDRQYL
jgi:D-arginine dehydrogenase